MVGTYRPTVFERRQIGVEPLGGAGPVAATVLLQAMSFVLAPDAEVDVFGPEGQKYDTLTAMNKEWTAFDITGRPTYTEVVYFFSSLLTNPVVSTPGGATLARRWLWQPKSAAPDSFRTYTVEQGVPGGTDAERATGCAIREGSLTMSRNGGNELAGAGIGRRMEVNVALSGNEVQQVAITGGPTGGTFTLTFSGQTTAPIAYNAAAAAVQAALEGLSNLDPGDVLCTGGALPGTAVLVEFRGNYAATDVPAMTATPSFSGGSSPAVVITTPTPGAGAAAIGLVPILPGEVDVFVDATAAGLGVTKLLGDFDYTWELGDRFNPVYVLNSALTSYDRLLEAKPSPSLGLVLSNNVESRDFLAKMRAGTTSFVRMRATGPLIETGQNYRLTVDVAAKVAEAPSRGDQDGASTLEWTLRPVHDATWGRAMEVELITSVTTL